MGTGGSFIRGDALRIPLRDRSVNLIVTSPPYFALRSYRDGGEHCEGQIGSEPGPHEFIAALLTVTAELARVLTDDGSMFINLGDKYAGSGGGNQSGVLSHRNAALADVHETVAARGMPRRYNQNSGGIPAKSLMLLPERYRIGCVDQLGLLARAVVVWDKPNGLPESVTDRVRRSHEDWVHITKQGRYYSAIDEIREPYSDNKPWGRRSLGEVDASRGDHGTAGKIIDWRHAENPLGKLPGSVWRIPSEPLQVPEWVGVDHYAAFPQEWPRRLILGWSPPGICLECGEARTPALSSTEYRTITGYRCACPDTTAPTRPAVVLDPFSGTGCTVGVARVLGRYGIGIDLSADYIKLAKWRVWESGHFGKTLSRTNRARQGVLL